jgi:hypothetical protein
LRFGETASLKIDKKGDLLNPEKWSAHDEAVHDGIEELSLSWEFLRGASFVVIGANPN